LDDAPFVSVIVATRDRAESLTGCLNSLLAMEYPNFEIVVVDNAPSTSATAELINRRYRNTENVRYVREDQPGLASAHNRGLREINASIVAFTDDDVRVDKHWLAELVGGFGAAPNVGCVTGMIQPAELETPAQLWIEQYSGFSKGFAKRVFDLNTHRPDHPLFPYAAGTMGSGASMAFRTEVLHAIGGFDSALGAGSKGVGGDDLAAFFEVVIHGYAVVYMPSALLYHWHRRDYAGLRRQAYGYGVGLFAYLTKVIVDKPSRIVDFVLKAPYAFYYLLSKKSPKNKNKQLDYPRELTWIERKGMLYGPLAYLISRRAIAKQPS
jgi:O-antigen biosynthesis protein